MKILTVVGARPQFIKAAMVSRVLRKNHTEILVHTGQHYDYNMSEKFFEELRIPRPDYNLGVSGGSHGQMTGKMLIGIEDVLVKETPDMLLVYGDTNSTLAGALAAAKLHIPICHVEAGTRTHNIHNPEEINRICTDHMASLLLACTDADMGELEREGLADRAELVGDTMYDAFLAYQGTIRSEDIKLKLLAGGEIALPDRFNYMTCHREENTSDKNLTEICMAMEKCLFPTIYPVHPRNKQRALRVQKEKRFSKILLIEPVGYLESNYLVSNAEIIVTDSGGLQREAFFAGRQCITVLDFITWSVIHVNNRNQLAKPDQKDILEKMSAKQVIDENYRPFGDGHAAEKVVSAVERFMGAGGC